MTSTTSPLRNVARQIVVNRHYLSRCYLRNFTTEPVPTGHKPSLRVADLRRKKLTQRAPKNVACIPDYYAGRLEDGTLDHSIETQLWASIEADAAPVLRAVRRGRYELSDAELGVLVSIACVHFTRVPAVRQLFEAHRLRDAGAMAGALGSDRPRLERTITEAFPGRPFSEATLQNVWEMASNPDRYTLSIAPEATLNDIVEFTEGVAEAFNRMHWMLLVVATGGEFITSDRPVSTGGADAAAVRALKLLAPDLEVAFPICPQACLLGNWKHDAPRLAAITPDSLVDVNRRTRLGAVDACFSASRDLARWALDFVPHTGREAASTSTTSRSVGLEPNY
jgi:hypothetical protein